MCKKAAQDDSNGEKMIELINYSTIYQSSPNHLKINQGAITNMSFCHYLKIVTSI